SGLGGTDHCKRRVVGGISLEFFNRLGKHYGKSPQWRFEPHVALSTFKEMISEANVSIFLDSPLQDLSVEDKRIRSVRTTSGQVYTAKVFIDATYEGDLLALSGTSFTIGRESAQTYGESLAGVVGFTKPHQFLLPVSAYDDKRAPLPGVSSEPLNELGSGDHKIGAFNYRLCVTKHPENRIPFPTPLNYDPGSFEVLRRYLGKRPKTLLSELFTFLEVPNGKYDLNNRGPFSTDLVGKNWRYPVQSLSERRELDNLHREYTLSLLYFLLNDPGVPSSIKRDLKQFGLCKDEFQSTQHWPPQLYVREGRRMIGSYVLQEQDLVRHVKKDDSIGMASCPIESHAVDRQIDENGNVMNEGWIMHRIGAYEIPYRSILPKEEEMLNLLVPVAVSASRIAYSSLRMEPVFMILGQSAGVAATMAIDGSVSVQSIEYKKLRRQLVLGGQILGMRLANKVAGAAK
ncbi:MAG: FAD-dependent oxidoreductase, partial [Bdellovibrionales bacterium]|nr:FAD-dependent oxidoreductase [Bdellovibrionales bacterium]